MSQQFYEPTFPLAFDTEWNEPVPGWGFNPLLAGPRMIGVGDAAPVVAAAQSDATSIYHQVQTEASAHPLYYVGGAAAAGLLGYVLAPKGKPAVAAVAALLGLVGVHFAMKTASAPKPGLLAAGTKYAALPTDSTGISTPQGSVVVQSQADVLQQRRDDAQPSADTAKTITAASTTTADTTTAALTPATDPWGAAYNAPDKPKPVTAATTSTPSADQAAPVLSAGDKAALYTTNLASCQAMLDVNPLVSMTDCMRNAGTPLQVAATPVVNSGLLVTADAAAAMNAQPITQQAASQMDWGASHQAAVAQGQDIQAAKDRLAQQQAAQILAAQAQANMAQHTMDAQQKAAQDYATAMATAIAAAQAKARR